MITKPTCLSAGALRRLAQGEFLPDELRHVEDHLKQCEHCRLSIQAAEADALWLNAILPVLKMPNEAAPSCGDSDDGADGESVLSLLGPTDDPHMLGRIGPYEVTGIVGRGGMGVVFKAFDAALNRFVAIKMLLPQLAASGAARQRFSREGQAAAAVIDDHVLPIYGVDDWQGIPYLVTQYSSGVTLQKRIDEQGALELKEILRIGVQTARGLAAAHAQGLVHRDVKPSNILLDGTVERVLLTDFGLARAADDASVTRTGTVAGTPEYMSPEQVRGEVVDARSDLFCLGSTFYAMGTGRSPFRSNSTYGVMHRITECRPAPIWEINPDLPEWVGCIVAKLMSRRPEDRFESADEVADLLEDCLAHVQQPTAVQLPERCRELRENFGPGRNQKRTAATRPFVLRRLSLLALGLAGALAAVLIVLDFNKGKLTIESEADGVAIRITQDGETVERLTVNRTGTAIRVASGKYRVAIDGDADALTIKNGNTVTLRRRGEQIVKIVETRRSPSAEPADGASGAVRSGADPRPPRVPREEAESVQDRSDLEKSLIGTWLGGRSLIPVRHTFHADGSYEFMIPPEYTDGIEQPKPGQWTLVGRKLSWEITEGSRMAHIERIDGETLVFQDGSFFQRVAGTPR